MKRGAPTTLLPASHTLQSQSRSGLQRPGFCGLTRFVRSPSDQSARPKQDCMFKPTFISGILSGVACNLLLSAVSSISYGANPYDVSPPSGKHWTITFDDEFTQDASINTNKWNGGAGGTDWCGLDFHGKPGGGYMFGETNDPCGQHYEGWHSQSHKWSGDAVVGLSQRRAANRRHYRPECQVYPEVWVLGGPL